ncbi:methyltransferase [Xanthomonas cerealis pv. cerealis]|uniref:methyltransferase n=1 Tax=Xanthomonas cerealis TaxID=3390025 RepID=UPI001F3BE5A3|nr:methyltransferase [Xanthomonas translucens]UKE70177.1 methyltransferase [Xanthomonas translucens pv. pistacia]
MLPAEGQRCNAQGEAGDASFVPVPGAPVLDLLAPRPGEQRLRQSASLARPTPLPTGMAGWLRTFAAPFLAGLNAAIRHDILANAVALLTPTLCDDHDRWSADDVRLRFHAMVPALADA